jgi:hypothetical protein
LTCRAAPKRELKDVIRNLIKKIKSDPSQSYRSPTELSVTETALDNELRVLKKLARRGIQPQQAALVGRRKLKKQHTLIPMA